MSALIARASLGLPVAYEAPAPASREAAIAQAFSHCLRLDQVGGNDCFFDLGGDSLAAQELALIIARDLGISFPVSVLAEASTPRQLAAALQGMQGTQDGFGAQPDTRRARAPIFAVHGMQGFMMPRKAFLEGLHPDQKLLMFELPGIRNKEPRLKTVPAIAQAYCRQIAQQHPTGPIHLIGFCMGSMIAMEMTVQLAQAGRSVDTLILIEPNLAGAVETMYNMGQWDDPEVISAYEGEARRVVGEARFRGMFLKSRQAGTDHFLKRYPGMEFSVDARAKLMAAFQTYRPRRVEMSTHVIVSSDRLESMRTLVDTSTPSAWQKILPNRRIHVAGETHDEVLASSSGKTSALVQSIIDGTVDAQG